MGLRTGEITTARIENMNLESGNIYITNSKKHHLYPVPVSYDVATLAQKVIGDRTEGWLIQRRKGFTGKREGKSLSINALWHIPRRYACKAGIQHWQQYNLRLLRHYFAATFAKGKNGKLGNIEALRRILRHKNLARTQIYLSRLVFWEDIQQEFNRLQKLPLKRRNMNVNSLVNEGLASARISTLYREQCSLCEHERVCRHVDQAASSEWADSCRFFKIKETPTQ